MILSAIDISIIYKLNPYFKIRLNNALCDLLDFNFGHQNIGNTLLGVDIESNEIRDSDCL